MIRKRKRSSKLLLADRAVSDLIEIEAHSIQQWGKRTASRYLKAIETSLQLIRDDPNILRTFDGIPHDLKFYRVNKHLVICDVGSTSVVVITIVHGSVDIPGRLAELMPQLSAEVAMLHKRSACE